MSGISIPAAEIPGHRVCVRVLDFSVMSERGCMTSWLLVGEKTIDPTPASP
jgi:hypothetical protein